MDDEYEIMPHRTIESIKKELDELKLKAASKESVSNEEFKKSLDNLSTSINGMMNLFKEATEEMRIEEETEGEMKESLGPLKDKMDMIENENRAIAKAILTVADLIEERIPPETAAPKREIITKTYRETIKPKDGKLPEMKSIPESKMTKVPNSHGHHEMHVRPVHPSHAKPESVPMPRIAPMHPMPGRPAAPMPEQPAQYAPGPLPPRPGPSAPMSAPRMPAPRMSTGAPKALPPLPMGPRPDMPPIGKQAEKKGFFAKLFKK